ncbi:MAG TPA: DUF5686 family protein [Dysgonamonadaceae bacterium]|nr:DUF5686 family protein [Dysgonamonadaceae bacterium]
MVISCLGLMAQPKAVIKGVVLDSVNNTPLPYVALFFEGSSIGDISNSGGEFTIDTSWDVVSERLLKVMFTGYKTQVVKLNSDSLLSVQLFLSPAKEKEEIPALKVFRILGDEGRNPLPYYIYKLASLVVDDNLSLGNPQTNKVDLYNLQEIPAYNHLEGIRLRLSAATNARLHPHLFAKGNVGYGFKDQKLKYRGELAWSFDEKAYHDDEFPRNNIRLIHEYDIFSPGENNPRLRNDFLLLSYRRSKGAMTYRKFTELNYEKETLYGLSYLFWARMSEIKSASELNYSSVDITNYPNLLSALKSKNAGFSLRFWPREAYLQSKRIRTPYWFTEPLFMLSHTVGENTVFGGNELYHKTELSFQKRIDLHEYGHLDLVADYQKVWTKAPFPLLLYPNANKGFIVDNKAFFLIKAMEFINDEQYSLRATYVADNLLFSHVPLFNKLGFRELFILRGTRGKLSNKNIPSSENGLFVLPQQTIKMSNTPYLEGVVGITNILGLLRVEYIHRLTYRNYPGVLKYGFRLDVTF